MDMLVKHVLKVGWGPGEAKKKERSLPCVLRALTLLQIQTCLDEKSTKASKLHDVVGYQLLSVFANGFFWHLLFA